LQPYNGATELAKVEYEKKKSAYEASLKPTEAVKSVCPFSSIYIPTSILIYTPPIQPETAASVPAHQDTSDDDEPEHSAPAPVIPTTSARIKFSPTVRPSHPARSAPVVQQEEGSSENEDENENEDMEEEPDKDMAPPPKKKARKSPPPPPPVVTKEKEKEKVKKEKERKERKEKKPRD